MPDRWHERFMKVKARAKVLVMPNILGPTPDSASPYERCNLWMLEDALRIGSEKLYFICCWDGGGGDGPGGTRHLVEAVCSRGGEVRWLDVTKLW